MLANSKISAFGQRLALRVSHKVLCNTLLVALISFSFSSVFAEERTVERTLETRSGIVELSIVDGTGATTDISTGEPGRVVVEATITGFLSRWGRDTVRKRVEELLSNPPIKQEGNSITVGKLPWRIRKDLSISYRILVPPNTNVHTAGPETVRVQGLIGNLQVNNATTIASDIRGDVTLKRAQLVRVTGVTGNLYVSGGQVTASDIKGDATLKRVEHVSMDKVSGRVNITDRVKIVNLDDVLVDIGTPGI